MLHKDLAGEQALHQFCLPSETDPGPIGAYKGWLIPSTGVIMVRDAANAAWIQAGSSKAYTDQQDSYKLHEADLADDFVSRASFPPSPPRQAAPRRCPPG